MKMIDLSHTISTGMTVYPGTATPEFSDQCTINRDGFCEKKITMFSHTGTHVDAPSHIFKKAKSLDQIPISGFSGNASVLDFSHIQKTVITYQDLARYEPLLIKSDFILLFTGWYKKWGEAAYLKNFPALSIEAAEWIANFSLKGIGVDMISVDQTDTRNFPIHRIFLKKNILIIENLTALKELVNIDFTFFCFPMKVENSDGAPVRAVAQV
ncbi:MAG: cyclase family protein [Deltaproteobacteria bacterium]|nr:cyclase family protein [Deltaproteobacteria bacterium]